MHFDSESNVIDVYVRYLRREIDDLRARPLIHTVRSRSGQGSTFTVTLPLAEIEREERAESEERETAGAETAAGVQQR